MKYAIIIPDGCADEPVATLGNKTPLQAARMPHADNIARAGCVALSDNVPPSLTPASDVATLSLVGYDPMKCYTGRAPLETVAMGIPLGPYDWAVRCNLVYAPDGHMRDFTAGHITSEDGWPLMETLHKKLGGPHKSGGTLEFHAGVQYRNILVWRGSGPDCPLRGMKTQPPHDVPDQPLANHLPQGPGRDMLIELMEASKEIIQSHPATKERIEEGHKPATQIWLWGQGQAPQVEPFEKVYGPKGAIISAVDLVRGVGMLVGWKRIDVPGATGYLDTDYAAKGKYGIEALKHHDLVCVHVEAPDEASHEGRADEKVKALERIDEHIIGPMHAALKTYGDYRIFVSPDHRTTLRTRAHAYGAVPVAVCGKGIPKGNATAYDEPNAEAGSLKFTEGWKLMNWFLGKQ